MGCRPTGWGLPGPWAQELWWWRWGGDWDLQLEWGLRLPRTLGGGRGVGVRQAQSAHPHRCTFDVAQASGQRTSELPGATLCIKVTQFSGKLQEMWAHGGGIGLRTELLAGNQGSALEPHMKGSFYPDASQCAHAVLQSGEAPTSASFFPISLLPLGEGHTAEVSVRRRTVGRGKGPY